MKFDSSKHSRSLAFVWGLVVLFLAGCVVYPLVCVIKTAAVQDLQKIMTQPVLHEARKNTVLECLCSTSLSVIVGYIFAYAVVKSNIPLKKFFSITPVLHLITPPFVGGLSFILLFGRQGLITQKILGLDVSLYGFPGLIITQTLCFFPMAYLICAQVLRGIDSDLEKVARGLGAGEFKIFFTITFPLSLPGILSSFLFIAVSVLSDFGNPLIIGGRFRVLAVEIYTQLTGWLDVGISAMLGIILVVPSVILFLIQNRLNKKLQDKTSTISGKGFRADEENQSPVIVRIFLFVFVAFVSLVILAQIASIIAGSFQKIWGINTEFTLQHIISMKDYIPHLSDSVFFALIAAVFSTAIASVSSFLVHRTDVHLKKTIDVVVQLPSAIPGSLLGLSLAIASQKIHFVYSSVLIVIAMTVAFMPFAYRVISNTYAQINPTLDNGARSLGANPMTVLGTVIMPVSRGGLFSGFIYDFIRGVGTLSAVIFLVSFDTPLASIQLINLAEQGSWGKSAALALVLTLITFLILGFGLLFNRLFFKNRGKNVSFTE